MEEAANRGDIRRKLRGGGGMDSHGNLSYFAGYYRGNLGPYRKMLEDNYRKVFVEGSDVSKGAIDNSSIGLAYVNQHGGQSGQYGHPGMAPGRFQTNANFGGDRITGHSGVESFESPGWGQSGTGEREFYPKWREEQLRSARNPAESTLGAERPSGPAAPNAGHAGLN